MKWFLFIAFLLVFVVVVENSSRNFRLRRSVWGFGRMVRKLTHRNPLDYYRYGNWCGLGGGGPPVDGIDRCCKSHDECYDRHNKFLECRGAVFNVRSYFSIYDWDYNEERKKVTCSKPDRSGSSNTKCKQILCECDRKAAECFSRNIYHPHYKQSLFRTRLFFKPKFTNLRYRK